jgi:glycosyltransferase involved in cell wall biosynthesis
MISSLITVIIPTYNYSGYICEAIDSVLNLDGIGNEIEIIVIDDGSTDDTPEVVKVYQDRIKYLRQENQGKAWATKVGIDCATGKYLFNLDADDLFLPSKIKNVVNIFESDRDIIHVSHPAIYWNVNDNTKVVEAIPEEIIGSKLLGQKLLSYFYKKRMLFGGGSTFATRTEVAKKFKIPKEVDMYIDEYLVLLSLKEGYSYFLKDPLSVWRIHGKNFSDVSFDREEYQRKSQRSIRSMNAVLQSLMEQEFDPEIVNLYTLKNQVMIAAIKESLGEKSISDIVSLWSYILKNFRVTPIELVKIIKHYTIVNRSLPTPILKLLKEIKKTMYNRQ